MIDVKIVSSLEKVFIDQSINDFESLEHISVLRGESVSFQLLYTYDGGASDFSRANFTPTFSGSLSKYVRVRKVTNVPLTHPTTHWGFDEHYIRTKPGLYPDLLEPLNYGGKIVVSRSAYAPLESLWIDIDIPTDAMDAVGESELSISLIDENGSVATRTSLAVDVINATLPKQELIFTQWFHCDGLANYYGVPVWSDRHWEIIESFIRTAVKGGINMILTPVFTPPLDTAIGGERLTTQLVTVKKNGEKYTFGYKLLDRWVDMCLRLGIKYFEICHLFTQWGANHAPKIMATVDGEYKKIFGWETDAHGEEYRTFIRTFLKSLIKHMKSRGLDKLCYYHVSDEPSSKNLENYKKSKGIVSDLLRDYVIMDALSDYDFYKQGIVSAPIPSNDHIAPFIEDGVKGLWTYYCCAQGVKVSNRFIAMPSARTRSIGMQMYKYDIVGFLHWGYNFYNNILSVNMINPYLELSGENWVPAGDAFSVYPAPDGTALESLRFVVFKHALNDIGAMRLCESLCSKAEVVAAIEEELGGELTFDRCAYDADTMLKIRERINSMIKARI